MPDRRTVIAGGAAVAAAGAGALALTGRAEAMPGTLAGADFARGHRLIRGDFPVPTREEHTRVAIVGGGVAGLSAAWTLAEAGVTDFRLFELEDRPGGNARSGRNAVSAYPLGAHYLPIPNPEAKAVLRLLERLGIVTGWRGGKPVFDPYQIVADPDERLLHLGRWQEGLVPTRGLSARDRADLDAFFAAMTAFRARVGADGRPAFALPMELSSRDPDLLALDRLSFTDWLHAQGWRSPMLHAHVRYSCRDDYGTEPRDLSAWAGIHYWAGRRGAAANCDGDAVLTWPGGNGHLTEAMAARVRPHIASASVAFRLARVRDHVEIDVFDATIGVSKRIVAESAILATPHFITTRLLGEAAADWSYAPWLVANVTVDRPPAGPGARLAWDNVSWTSRSLGYVVAGHQSLASTPGPTVLTWYQAVSEEAPATARKRLLSTPLAEWQRLVRDDLLLTNPDLDGAIRRIDIWRWGHAMVRPVPGFFWSGAREATAGPRPPLFFAHADLSGLSLFEEANYRGARAAEDAMAHLAIPHASLLA